MELENYELNLKCSLEKLKQYGRINGGGYYQNRIMILEENKQLKDNWNKVKNIIEDERMSHWTPGPLFLTELLISMEKIDKM